MWQASTAEPKCSLHHPRDREILKMPVMMHAKVVVIDHSLVVVESHNLTEVRFDSNFEVSLANRDLDFVDKINGLPTALQKFTIPLDRDELLESKPQPVRCKCCIYEFPTPARKRKQTSSTASPKASSHAQTCRLTTEYSRTNVVFKTRTMKKPRWSVYMLAKEPMEWR